MFIKHTAALLAASVIALPAVAQTTTAPAPGTAATAAAPAGMGGVQFIQAREQGHYRASDLIGSSVFGADNARIGDINDVLLSRQGQVTAVVLGVGGFLGLGEKDVALPMQALRFETAPMNPAAAPGASMAPGAGTAMTVPPQAPGAAGTAPMAVPPAGMAADMAQARRGVPDRIVVQLTRQQLDQAPAFRDDMRRAAPGGVGTTGNMGVTAPDGTPGNPPGTAVGRAVDRALGTDATGTNPGGAATGTPGTGNTTR